jgi:hypothetical protein
MPLTVKALLLLQDNDRDSTELKRFIEQIAVLWKFRFKVCNFSEGNSACDTRECSNVFISYSSPDPSYEDWCTRIITSLDGRPCLLLDSEPKAYTPHFIQLFGVRGIEGIGKANATKLIRKKEDLIVIHLPIEMRLSQDHALTRAAIERSECIALLENRKGKCFLSKQNFNYCLTIPVWQFGTTAFPFIFYIVKDFLFSLTGVGHFSPYPFVSLRIDDYPVTSEQYLRTSGVSDHKRTEEIGTLVRWAKDSGAKLEFMVNSKILGETGDLLPMDQVVPNSCRLLKEYYDAGVININAHGRSHIDEERYIQTKEISPFEFSHLSPEETEQHILDCTEFIERFFCRRSLGFVPPCWSYREGVTKKICRSFFSFVVDSSTNFQYGHDCPASGFIDDAGMVHIAETWHLGAKDFDHRDPALWRAFLHCGIPIHMMCHGPYIYDPLPKKLIPRLLLCTLLLLIFPLYCLIHPKEAFQRIQSIASRVKWGRLDVLRQILSKAPFFKNASLRTLMMAGKRLGVKWAFTEELANHLREFAGLEVTNYQKNGDLHLIRFNLNDDCKGPFLFHLPQRAVSGTLDGFALPEVAHRNVLKFTGLARGHHALEVEVQ